MKEFLWGMKVGVIVYLLWATISNVMGVRSLTESVALLEHRIQQLETTTVYLRMEVGTNRLLMMEMQRKFVPNHVALKERLAWQTKP